MRSASSGLWLPAPLGPPPQEPPERSAGCRGPPVSATLWEPLGRLQGLQERMRPGLQGLPGPQVPRERLRVSRLS